MIWSASWRGRYGTWRSGHHEERRCTARCATTRDTIPTNVAYHDVRYVTKPGTQRRGADTSPEVTPWWPAWTATIHGGVMMEDSRGGIKEDRNNDGQGKLKCHQCKGTEDRDRSHDTHDYLVPSNLECYRHLEVRLISRATIVGRRGITPTAAQRKERHRRTITHLQHECWNWTSTIGVLMKTWKFQRT